MQIPVDIEFQGTNETPEARAMISEHVRALEARFGQVVGCRVVLKAPGGHHRNGGLYEVTIRLTLPDSREVNIARTPQQDERHADLAFAVNDAFKRARRQLEGQVQRMQGSVKRHSAPSA